MYKKLLLSLSLLIGLQSNYIVATQEFMGGVVCCFMVCGSFGIGFVSALMLKIGDNATFYRNGYRDGYTYAVLEINGTNFPEELKNSIEKNNIIKTDNK